MTHRNFCGHSQTCKNQQWASSCCPLICMEQLGSYWRDYHEIWYLSTLQKSVMKIQFSLKSGKNNLVLHEDIYTFMTALPSVLLRMRNVCDKSCTGNQNTQNSLSFSRKTHRLWENVDNYCTAGHATGDETIWRMRFAWSVPKATNTHSEYVILIAFPLHQWLREHISMLRSAFIACPV